jgi:hypothetical protein
VEKKGINYHGVSVTPKEAADIATAEANVRAAHVQARTADATQSTKATRARAHRRAQRSWGPLYNAHDSVLSRLGMEGDPFHAARVALSREVLRAGTAGAV